MVNTRNTLNTKIIVFYIYTWSLTSNFTVSFAEDFKSEYYKNKSGNAKTCFHLHVHVPIQFLLDQKNCCFSSTQLIFLTVIIPFSHCVQRLQKDRTPNTDWSRDCMGQHY